MIQNMIKEGKIVPSETGIVPEFVLFFDCPEEDMEKRLLGRNQGREDDNIDTIRKRFKVFLESSLPVIEYYNSKTMCSGSGL
ncbi:putative UMP/CMP kinase [Helianthus annuus]|uniref:adenylate kinase n=1 Tax=Helianthus annuus TaxID=4232 RepID=A0A9K3DV41_HELAN|nr:putative UMP/CMP kinase [Helianthus annuus]KAJ0439183.1 putative UMP/CMP kinase [Helianthus annuus]KAJ0461533.1 putative UMP/CMP kinase [Helianthus annuus]KAJ0645833.1 putative UMP/CMP kinase [Helianthus annuus]KAJ0822398.1 putative UMP/CMP kinase [Helianthus annuus]